jgi:hypothetical protein
MPIPQTRLHANRVLEQIMNNVIGLQRDMKNNAQTHRAMAVAQSPDIATLRRFVDDAAASYLTRLDWGTSIVNTPAKLTILNSTLSRVGLVLTDITDITDALEDEALALQAASKNSFEEIIAACDTVLAEINLPESLWPE